MTGLRRWLLATTVATYFLIFVGGLVRVSGAGLGCPDWPKCFGRWIPPTDLSQVPAGFDPQSFNIALAWIEYINRLIGVLILVSSVVAIRKARGFPRILYPVLAALVLVAFQGWQGGQVVGSKLAPFIVTIHMALAFVIVSLLLYATLQSYHGESGRPKAASGTPRDLRRWLGVLWGLSIIAIALGTQVRSGVEEFLKVQPGAHGAAVLEQVGAVRIWHLVLGVLIVLATGYVAGLVVRRTRTGSRLLVPGAWTLAALSVAQVVVGFLLIAVGLPPFLQVLHLWISSLYVGALLVVHFGLAHSQERVNAP